MVSVAPFKFKNLKSYSRDQVALEESLSTYLSAAPFEEGFLKVLTKILEKALKVPCQMQAEAVRPISGDEMKKLLPETSCFVLVGAAPSEHKFIVDLDLIWSHYAIDLLLGGKGQSGRIHRPLSEIEQGVLSFILLKTLAHFTQSWVTGQELALSLDGFAAKPDELERFTSAESSYYLVGVRILSGKCRGYARILIPQELVSAHFNAAPQQHSGGEVEQAYIRQQLNCLGEGEIVGCVEIAEIDLDASDIANLEVGDIIVLENHQVSLNSDVLSGEAFVRLGMGKNGGLRGRLLLDDDRPRMEIIEIKVQEEPAEVNAMGSEEGVEEVINENGAVKPQALDDSGDNLLETEGLLRDVPAPIVVELGRIRLNTSQVVRLRRGQILRLPRGSNDPVDLVVNGKLFARGELIEVDGELGVRLLKMSSS